MIDFRSDFGDFGDFDDFDEPDEMVPCPECNGTGYAYHDCAGDMCCCLRPENVLCSECGSQG